MPTSDADRYAQLLQNLAVRIGAIREAIEAALGELEGIDERPWRGNPVGDPSPALRLPNSRENRYNSRGAVVTCRKREQHAVEVLLVWPAASDRQIRFYKLVWPRSGAGFRCATWTSDTRIFVPTYNARDNIESSSMSRFTSSRIARIFNIVLLDCATLAVGSAGLTIVGLAALRCFWNIDLTYNNEGWNAYYQAAALRGENVYPPTGAFVFNNYPPLSFIVIGALARFGGDVVVIGRLISVGSLIVIAISSGIIVNNLSNRSGRSGIVTAAVCLAAFCVISPVYVGINDPQLFGQAIMTVALAVYTRAPERPSNLFITVVLMATAGMTKHNLLAVPIAIALDVMMRSPRRAMLFLTFSIIALLSCAWWMQVISDGRVWSSIMSPRPYSFLSAAKLACDFFASAFPLVFIGAIGVVGRLSKPGPRLVASYGFVALLVGGILGGGSGVDQNVYFDVIIASALGVGLLVDELVGRTSMSFVGIPGTLLAALLIVASVISPVFQDSNKFRPLYLLDDSLARAFIDGTSYLRARPGDAICHNLLLCFRAGKPFVFDIWSELYGWIPAGQVSNLMESGVVKTVQLSEFDADLLVGGGLPNGPNSALLKWKKQLVDRLRFYKEVRQRYKLHHRSTGLAFFVAR